MNKVITVILLGALNSFSSVTAPLLHGRIASAASPASLSVAIAPSPVKAAMVPSTSATKSFKEWKNEKAQMAIKKVTITKAQMEYRKLNKQFLQRTEIITAKDPEMDRLEAQLKDDLYSLEVAQSLSVTEYFAVYLIKQENKEDAYKEAAIKMTDDEVNQLIRAFADSMFASNGNSRTSFKVGPTAMDKLEIAK